MKKLFITWLAVLKAKTPIMWVVVRNLSIGIIAAVGVINTTASTAIAPAWYSAYQWYILAGASILGFFAQSHQKTPPTV
jgi:hypothetical protein